MSENQVSKLDLPKNPDFRVTGILILLASLEHFGGLFQFIFIVQFSHMLYD